MLFRDRLSGSQIGSRGLRGLLVVSLHFLCKRGVNSGADKREDVRNDLFSGWWDPSPGGSLKQQPLIQFFSLVPDSHGPSLVLVLETQFLPESLWHSSSRVVSLIADGCYSSLMLTTAVALILLVLLPPYSPFLGRFFLSSPLHSLHPALDLPVAESL